MENIFEMLGQPAQPKPDRKMSMAMFLRHLAAILDEAEGEEQEETHEYDARATEREEVKVRPRIEPLGGN